MAYTEEGYIEEYNKAYEEVLASSMESATVGKDSPLEKMFELIDAARVAEEITVIEQLSIKKNAYMNLIQGIVGQSQKTAMALVDKKYKFQGELDSQLKAIELQDAQIAGAAADTENKETSTQALIDQVTHNRMIKTLSSVANVNGMALGGGVAVGTEQLDQFNDLVYELVPEIV